MWDASIRLLGNLGLEEHDLERRSASLSLSLFLFVTVSRFAVYILGWLRLNAPRCGLLSWTKRFSAQWQTYVRMCVQWQRRSTHAAAWLTVKLLLYLLVSRATTYGYLCVAFYEQRFAEREREREREEGGGGALARWMNQTYWFCFPKSSPCATWKFQKYPDSRITLQTHFGARKLILNLAEDFCTRIYSDFITIAFAETFERLWEFVG